MGNFYFQLFQDRNEHAPRPQEYIFNVSLRPLLLSEVTQGEFDQLLHSILITEMLDVNFFNLAVSGSSLEAGERVRKTIKDHKFDDCRECPILGLDRMIEHDTIFVQLIEFY